MPRFPMFITGTAILALCAGCAAQSSARTAAGPPAATAPPVNYSSKQILQFAFDQGYRPQTHDGKTIYCRREVPIGSNLPETRCVTATELRFQVLRAQRDQQLLEQGAPMVGQPPGN